MYGSQTRRSYLLRLLLLTNQILNHDRRRQKIPFKARSEPQGSYQRGVRKKKARQERVFKTYSESGQKSSGNRSFLYAPSQVLVKHSVQIGCTECLTRTCEVAYRNARFTELSCLHVQLFCSTLLCRGSYVCTLRLSPPCG